MEYMAARMDAQIEGAQHWYEEIFCDAMDAIRENPQLSKVYAVLYTDCIYESAAAPVSLHWTKAGAYRALNDFLFRKWQEYNTDPFRKKYAGRGTKALNQRMQWWGIREFAILP